MDKVVEHALADARWLDAALLEFPPLQSTGLSELARRHERLSPLVIPQQHTMISE